MTPLAPLVPYTATDETSFNISIDAISAGFISLNEPANGTPSTTTNGSVDALIEFAPLTCAFGVDPGTDEPWVMVTPATAPCTA